MNNIDPQLLQLLLSGQPVDGYYLGRGNSVSDGTQGIDSPMITEDVIYQGMDDPSGFGTGTWNTWNTDGSYRGFGSGDSELRGLAKAVAMAAAMYGGASALSGSGGAGAAGAGGAGGGAGGAAAGGAGAAGGSSITLPTLAEAGFTAASVTPELLATMPAMNIAGGAAAGGAAGAAAGGGGGGAGSQLGTTGVNSMRAGELAGYASNGSMPSSAAQVGGNMSGWDTLLNGAQQAVGAGAGSDPNSWANVAGRALGGGGNGSPLGGLLGGLAGAASSRDQTQSTNRDPWGPAQPFLRGLLDQGQQLQQQYREQPFSPLQQQAYQNQFGLLNAFNQAAPGLLQGMQQTASGANSYDRSDPRRRPTGSNPQFQWTPGLLNAFGG